jgi:N-acylneuraminate cytidylyltransferase
MSIAVIPARGGSKRIPRKNIRPFCGKPIIAYSIDVALRSGLFSSVIVSTDDEEIADVARSFGADVPFMRPAHLADDFTGTGPVLIHALRHFQEQGQKVDALCCIYATSPFTTVEDITRGYEALQTAPAAFTVTNFSAPPFWALKQDDQGRMAMLESEYLDVRSQDLPEFFHDTGQIYWGTGEFFLSGNDIQAGNAVGIHVPRYRTQDIDNIDDWVRAEIMYRVLKGAEQL